MGDTDRIKRQDNSLPPEYEAAVGFERRYRATIRDFYSEEPIGRPMIIYAVGKDLDSHAEMLTTGLRLSGEAEVSRGVVTAHKSWVEGIDRSLRGGKSFFLSPTASNETLYMIGVEMLSYWDELDVQNIGFGCLAKAGYLSFGKEDFCTYMRGLEEDLPGLILELEMLKITDKKAAERFIRTIGETIENYGPDCVVWSNGGNTLSTAIAGFLNETPHNEVDYVQRSRLGAGNGYDPCGKRLLVVEPTLVSPNFVNTTELDNMESMIQTLGIGEVRFLGNDGLKSIEEIRSELPKKEDPSPDTSEPGKQPDHGNGFT